MVVPHTWQPALWLQNAYRMTDETTEVADDAADDAAATTAAPVDATEEGEKETVAAESEEVSE